MESILGRGTATAAPSLDQSGTSFQTQLDRLLVTLDVDVQSFALCQVQRGHRLIAEPVDAIMVHYVLSGSHYMTVPGHPPIACSAGSIVLIPPAFRPQVSLDDGPAVDVFGRDRIQLTREGLLLLDATNGGETDLRFVSGIVRASVSGSFGLLDNLTTPIAQHVESGLIRDAFTLMVDEVGSPDLGARALTSALMKACLILMLRRAMTDSAGLNPLLGALCDKRLGRSIGVILDRPGARHTVASLAEAAGMSRSAFALNFTQAFAMTPKAFVSKTRLHHAAQMLKSTQLPIKTVAASVGFSNRSHFSHAFRSAYGLDPTEFRSGTRDHPIDPPHLPADLSGTLP